MWVKTDCVRIMLVGSVGPHDGVVEIVVPAVILVALKGVADEGGAGPGHEHSDRQPVRPLSVLRDSRGHYCGVLQHFIRDTSCPHTVEVLVGPAVPIEDVVSETARGATSESHEGLFGGRKRTSEYTDQQNDMAKIIISMNM